MPRIRTLAVSCVASLVSLWLASVASAVDRSEALLPDTTVAFVSISDVADLMQHIDQTQLGKLWNDPVMEPSRADLERQFSQRWSPVEEKFGLKFADIQDVAGGETSAAVIQLAVDRSANVLLIDVTGKVAAAEELIQRVAATLTGRGARKTFRTVEDTPMVVFELVDEESQAKETTVYFLKNNLLGCSDDIDVLQGIIERIGGGKADALGGDDVFKVVIDRCHQDAGQARPQVRWFIRPVGYSQVLLADQPERDRGSGRSIIDILEGQGFDAMQSVGGFVDLSVDGYELLHRTAVHAPKPYQKAMKMMVFPNETDFSPQPWVPRALAAYYTGYINVMGAFDNFGSMFDALFGEGTTGAWEGVVDGFKKGPYSPDVDLRQDIAAKLGNRITLITDYELPITPESERIVFAVQVTDEDRVAKALAKLFEPDTEGPHPTRRTRTFKLPDGKEIIIWESLPVEKAAVPRISLEALPPLRGEEDDEEVDVEQTPLFPNTSIAVAHGELFIASHLQSLLKVLEHHEDRRETLGGTVDFKVVDATCLEIGAGQNCFRAFSRADEEYRPTYELIRQGKMPQSETLFGRILNTLFGIGADGEFRQQEIDGAKLPEFEVVRRHLGLAGAYGVSEESGWFFKGFLLPK